MHIPYFADFYHICICKIDEIMPLKRTAFLSPKQRYTFQIPPWRAASSLPGSGVPPEGMGVTPSAWVSEPRDPEAEPSCCAVSRAVRLDRGTAVLPRPRRSAVVLLWIWDRTLRAELHRVPGFRGRLGTGEMGCLHGMPSTLEISHSGLCSTEGFLLEKTQRY